MSKDYRDTTGIGGRELQTGIAARGADITGRFTDTPSDIRGGFTARAEVVNNESTGKNLDIKLLFRSTDFPVDNISTFTARWVPAGGAKTFEFNVSGSELDIEGSGSGKLVVLAEPTFGGVGGPVTVAKTNVKVSGVTSGGSPNISLSDVRISGTPPDNLVADIIFKNSGDASGNLTEDIMLDGNDIGDVNLIIQPGGTAVERQELPSLDAGSHKLSVSNFSQSFDINVESSGKSDRKAPGDVGDVTGGDDGTGDTGDAGDGGGDGDTGRVPADLKVSTLRHRSDAIPRQPGDRAVLIVRFRNDGGQKGSKRFSVSIAGKEVWNKTVRLASGQTASTEISYDAPKQSSYTVSAGSKSEKIDLVTAGDGNTGGDKDGSFQDGTRTGDGSRSGSDTGWQANRIDVDSLNVNPGDTVEVRAVAICLEPGGGCPADTVTLSSGGQKLAEKEISTGSNSVQGVTKTAKFNVNVGNKVRDVPLKMEINGTTAETAIPLTPGSTSGGDTDTGTPTSGGQDNGNVDDPISGGGSTGDTTNGKTGGSDSGSVNDPISGGGSTGDTTNGSTGGGTTGGSQTPTGGGSQESGISAKAGIALAGLAGAGLWVWSNSKK